MLENNLAARASPRPRNAPAKYEREPGMRVTRQLEQLNERIDILDSLVAQQRNMDIYAGETIDHQPPPDYRPGPGSHYTL